MVLDFLVQVEQLESWEWLVGTPALGWLVGTPSGGWFVGAPSGLGWLVGTPSKGRFVDAPSEGRCVDSPSKERYVDAPVREWDVAAPGSKDGGTKWPWPNKGMGVMAFMSTNCIGLTLAGVGDCYAERLIEPGGGWRKVHDATAPMSPKWLEWQFDTAPVRRRKATGESLFL